MAVCFPSSHKLFEVLFSKVLSDKDEQESIFAYILKIRS
ncbi:hypothetical protein GPSY_4649 [Paraglaciecola psychrophila 170]|nr:hypothetical protein GPSY_4649 [Paraglaciecola psychrophila 170]